MDDGIEESGSEGTDWTTAQIAVVVANYFMLMLQERAGTKFNKAELYRRLSPEVGRSVKSVEWKLRNVSAVLEKIGIAWLPGLAPAHNHQDALIQAVGAQLGLHPEILKDPSSLKPRFTSAGEPVLVDPPAALNSDADGHPPALVRLAEKYDPAERDEFNRNLGRAGEQMVMDFERRRLSQAGREDLARDVRWVSEDEGDHLGYDIRSFDRAGRESLIEVKTTNGPARTRFWLSRNQCDVAANNQETYRIRRVYHFRNGVEMFDIVPPLDRGLWLTPDKFVAVPK
ncbi:DUF3883 domain-containing protein [Tardiphaga sp. 1201_B9_N1_1]|uniref:DUF3883 domain-containing protein n=1 Tax=unclassified Tardiphaga TaxID=2631404 RepID=UPI003F1FC97E